MEHTAPMYFDDIEVGVTELSGEVLADRDEMVEYALRNDPFPIHVDEGAAIASPFGGVIASFGYTVSLYMRMMHDLPWIRATQVSFLGALEWKVQFSGAVRPGDRLRVKFTVTGARLTSSGTKGVITSRSDLLNQRDEAVVVIDVTSLVATRSSLAGPHAS